METKEEGKQLKQVVYPRELLDWAEKEGCRIYGATNFSELARHALARLRREAEEAAAVGQRPE